MAFCTVLLCQSSALDPHVGVWHGSCVPYSVHTSLSVPQIVAEYKAGDGMPTIAARHGVSRGTIRNLLIAANVPLRIPGYRGVAAPTQQVASGYTYRRILPVVDEELAVALKQEEVDRLRRSVGWQPDWARPYDPARGD